MLNKSELLIRIILSAMIIVFFTGCEEDEGPITSNTFSITVNSINQSDVSDIGVIEKDENISNGTGNPWSEFIKEAESEFGKLPQRFEIVSATVQLTDTEGLNSFEELVSGKMAVRFLSTQGSDADAAKVEIGNFTNPTGSSAIELTQLANASDLSVLRERLLGGDFHVGFWSQTNLNKDDTFSFDVIIKFVVRASS